MHIISLIFLSLAANLDNLSISLAYGIKKVRIPLLSNIVISSASGIITLITCIFGYYLRGVIPDHLCNIIGGCLISIMGIWTIIEFFLGKKKEKSSSFFINSDNHGDYLNILQHPREADMDFSGDISIKESVILGIALALNCFATGLGAGMTGLNAFAIAMLTIIFSFVSIYLGLKIGRKCAASWLGDKASIIAGLLLIVMGLYEVIV